MTPLEQVFGTDDTAEVLSKILDAIAETGQPFEDYVAERVAETYDPPLRWQAIGALTDLLGFAI